MATKVGPDRWLDAAPAEARASPPAVAWRSELEVALVLRAAAITDRRRRRWHDQAVAERTPLAGHLRTLAVQGVWVVVEVAGAGRRCGWIVEVGDDVVVLTGGEGDGPSASIVALHAIVEAERSTPPTDAGPGDLPRPSGDLGRVDRAELREVVADLATGRMVVATTLEGHRVGAFARGVGPDVLVGVRAGSEVLIPLARLAVIDVDVHGDVGGASGGDRQPSCERSALPTTSG